VIEIKRIALEATENYTKAPKWSENNDY